MSYRFKCITFYVNSTSFFFGSNFFQKDENIVTLKCKSKNLALEKSSIIRFRYLMIYCWEFKSNLNDLLCGSIFVCWGGAIGRYILHIQVFSNVIYLVLDNALIIVLNIYEKHLVSMLSMMMHVLVHGSKQKRTTLISLIMVLQFIVVF